MIEKIRAKVNNRPKCENSPNLITLSRFKRNQAKVNSICEKIRSFEIRLKASFCEIRSATFSKFPLKNIEKRYFRDLFQLHRKLRALCFGN
jgi:hypothetical protein